MSGEQDQQAVVEKPDAGAQPPATGADARDQGDDLDSLLSQYDETVQPKTEPKSTPEQARGTAEQPDALKSRLDALEKRIADEEFQKQISPVIKNVRGDIPENVMTDEEIQDWMEGRAKRDQRLTQAWIERAKNPQGWAKVQDGLRKELSKKFAGQPDPNATEDREAVTEAIVRGASNRAPEQKAPDFSKANNREFSDEVEAKYGFRPI